MTDSGTEFFFRQARSQYGARLLLFVCLLRFLGCLLWKKKVKKREKL